ncbi:MAG: hypothetical protein KGL37_04870, partial [Acidobacteriota bacterium]|nr:hypothetical protein [Acidobacteriota bacterium]
VQHRLAGLEGKLYASNSNFAIEMRKYAEQGKFGGQMGKLGAEMGRLAKENHRKIQTIIDESLKSGKAKPVQ